MRKLSKTLAMMSLLTPVGASALGIGEIKLHSALNQNLDAEIPLVTSKPANLSDIRVSLASPAAFERAGLERHFYLSNLRFRPVEKPNGHIVVQVSSRDAIREPYLNFLLEVDWPQGRLLREFTMLLDPPISFKESTIIEEPSQFLASDGSESVSTAKPPPSKERYAAAPKEVPSVSADGEYGPIMRNDSLWAIAKRLNTNPNVTQEQMMMALYEKNPHAFYQPNVNALKEGQTIRVPDAEELQRLPHKEASRAFYQQWSDWQQGTVSEVASAKPDSAVAQPEAQTQLKLLAPTEESTEGQEIGAAAGEGSVEEAEAALEMVENVRKENEALQERLFEMEEQVAEMEQLLKDKDDQLAKIQSAEQGSESPAVGDVADGSDQSTTPAEAVDSMPADQTAAVTGPADSPVDQAAKVEPPVTAGAKAPKTEDDGDLISDLTSNPTYVAAAVGAAMLGLVGFAYARRRRAAEIEDIIDGELSAHTAKGSETDDFIAPVLDDSTRPADTDRTTESAGPGGDSSFLSEFTPSDFDALESEQDEVDPISEADVYLAYGRYQQAEDLIRQAIENDPQREECKLKLLEIFFAAEDKDRFEAYAQELHDDEMHSNAEFWNKVSEMGRQICPLSALFGDAAAPFDTGEQELDDYLSDDFGGLTTEADEIAIEEESEDTQSAEIEELKFEDSDETGTASFDATELQEAVESDDDQQEPLEFDLSKEDEKVEPLGDSDEMEVETDSELDFVSDADSEAEQAEMASTETNMDFEPDISPSSQEADATVDEEEDDEGDFPSLTDMDEVETKLDLAKAYFDMDDQESARDILNEVLDEGDESQKKEAEALMQKLAS